MNRKIDNHLTPISKKLRETAVTVDTDVIFISHDKNPKYSERDLNAFIKFMDQRELPINLIRANVLPRNRQLNDNSTDAFVRLLMNSNSSFIIQSVLYVEAVTEIYKPINSPSIQIIGGTYIGHYRCLYFDGKKIYVYDSLPL